MKNKIIGLSIACATLSIIPTFIYANMLKYNLAIDILLGLGTMIGIFTFFGLIIYGFNKATE